MEISILDDYGDTLRTLACFNELKGHDVDVWTDHVKDVDALAKRLKDAEVLGPIRECTEIRAPLIKRLRNLRLISQRNPWLRADWESGGWVRPRVWYASRGVVARITPRASPIDGYDVAENKGSFFERCDVISLHLRLVESTRGVVIVGDLARMKPSSLFVHTSRAGLVEPGVLVDALEARRSGTAAIDVYEHEPVLDANYQLLQMPNVVCTPHIGYVTRDEFEIQFRDVFEQITAYCSGTPIHLVNPEELEAIG